MPTYARSARLPDNYEGVCVREKRRVDSSRLYVLQAATTMKHITNTTDLLIVFFAAMISSRVASAEVVFKCKESAEQGYKVSVVMPEEDTEYLASRNNAGDINVVEFGQKIGVGSITFDNMGGKRWSTKFIVTRRPRPNYSPAIGFFLFSDSPQTLRIDTSGTGPFPFELYDPFSLNGSRITRGICQ